MAISMRREQESKATTQTTTDHLGLAEDSVEMDAAPVDLQSLSQTTQEYDEAFVREILLLFRASEADTATELLDVIRTRDPIALTNAAHKAKGGALSAFAGKLAYLYGDLEKAARLEDWPKIDSLAPEIDAELRHVIAFIDDFAARVQK